MCVESEENENEKWREKTACENEMGAFEHTYLMAEHKHISDDDDDDTHSLSLSPKAYRYIIMGTDLSAALNIWYICVEIIFDFIATFLAFSDSSSSK